VIKSTPRAKPVATLWCSRKFERHLDLRIRKGAARWLDAALVAEEAGIPAEALSIRIVEAQIRG
jgi:hypothetical protein